MKKLRRAAAAMMAAVITAGSITSVYASTASPSEMPAEEKKSGLSELKSDVLSVINKILNPGALFADPGPDDLTDATAASSSDMVVVSPAELESFDVTMVASPSEMKLMAAPPKTEEATPSNMCKTEDTRSRGMVINLFDYDISSENPGWGDREANAGGGNPEGGINDASPLKFYGQGGPAVPNGSYNNYTGDSRARQGIVARELNKEDGYPKFIDDNGTEHSLGILFEPEDIPGKKTVYKNLNHLFRLDDEGYYYLNSDENFIRYDTSQKDNGDFKVYTDTYDVYSDNENNPYEMVPVGFYPLDEFNPEKKSVRPTDDMDKPEDGYNHQLGLTMTSKFYLPEDKKTANGDDLIFTFSGDDDIWVFVDKQLVLDMGGIHKPTHGEINFTQDTVVVEDGVVNWARSGDQIGPDAKLSDLVNLEPGKEYELKVFYMERGGVFSNLSIRTNLFQEKPKDTVTFKITKKWAAEEHPDEAKINILGDGDVVETITLNTEMPAQEVTLPKSKDGKDIEYTFEEETIEGWYPIVTNSQNEPLSVERTIWVKADELEEDGEYLLAADGRIITGGEGESVRSLKMDAPEDITADGNEYKGAIRDKGYKGYTWKLGKTPENDEGYEHYKDYWMLKQGEDRYLALNSSNYNWYVTNKDGYIEAEDAVYCNKIRTEAGENPSGLKLSTYFYWKEDDTSDIYLKLDEKGEAAYVNEDDYLWEETSFDDMKNGGQYIFVVNNWGHSWNGRDFWFIMAPGDSWTPLKTVGLWKQENEMQKKLPEGNYDEYAWTATPIPEGDPGYTTYKGSWILQTSKGQFLSLETPYNNSLNSRFVLSDIDGSENGNNYCNKMLFSNHPMGYTGQQIQSFYMGVNKPWYLVLDGQGNVGQTDVSNYSAVFRLYEKRIGTPRKDKASTFTLYKPVTYKIPQPLPDDVIVTNYPTGDLTVKKTVEGRTAGKPSFQFDITLDKKVTGTFGDIEFSEGEAKITLADGESQTAKGLPVCGYTVTEAQKTGFTVAGEAEQSGEIKAKEEAVVSFTNRAELLDINVRKVWDDEEDKNKLRPSAVSVQLYADGTAEGEAVTLNDKNSWTYTWKDLPKVNEEKDITYTVKETNVPAGYETVVTGSAAEGFTVTNTHKPELTDIKVTKVWADEEDKDKLRPAEVSVQLYADGTAEGEAAVLNEANSWTYTWTGLSKIKGEKEIAYTVEETKVPSGYSAEVTGSAAEGFTVTNTHNPELTDIKVTKVWADEEDKEKLRPAEVSVQLYADGTAEGEAAVLNEANSWTYTWTGLYKKNGEKDITYTVEETKVPAGYEAKVTGTAAEGFTVTNTHKPELTKIKVTKVWVDKNNDSGLRPEEIKIQLYADGKETGSPVILNQKNNWTYTWTELPAKNSEGAKIAYTADETEIPAGYEKTLSGDAASGLVITNSLIPGRASGGGNGGGGGGVSHRPGFPVTPATAEGAESAESAEAPAGVLGAARELGNTILSAPQGVLGAARTGDPTALGLLAFLTLAGAGGMYITGRKLRRKDDEK